METWRPFFPNWALTCLLLTIDILRFVCTQKQVDFHNSKKNHILAVVKDTQSFASQTQTPCKYHPHLITTRQRQRRQPATIVPALRQTALMTEMTVTTTTTTLTAAPISGWDDLLAALDNLEMAGINIARPVQPVYCYGPFSRRSLLHCDLILVIHYFIRLVWHLLRPHIRRAVRNLAVGWQREGNGGRG